MQSTAPFTMLPCSVTHQESSGITGKLCFSSRALSHNNRGVPVRRRSLSKAVQEGGHHTPTGPVSHLPGSPHPCWPPPPACHREAAAREFPLTAPSSQLLDKREILSTILTILTRRTLYRNIRWVPRGISGQQSESN